MRELKAIQTEYKGYRFRSRLEARWAVLLDELGVKWEYEPEGYDLLEKNMERRQQIMQFFTKGLLDPAVYAEENDALADEESRLTSEKEMLSGRMSGSHDQQEALTRLLRYTAKGRTITVFDGELFTEHVDHVVIYKRTEIGFAMKCGPIFRERI